jgi:hypothetical protein
MVKKTNSVAVHTKPGNQAPGTLRVCVRDGVNPLSSGSVSLYRADDLKDCSAFDPDQWLGNLDDCEFVADNGGVLDGGCHLFSTLSGSHYIVSFDHDVPDAVRCVEVHSGCRADVCFDLALDAKVKMAVIDGDCRELPCATIQVGNQIEAELTGRGIGTNWVFTPPPGWKNTDRLKANTRALVAGPSSATSTLGIPHRAGGQAALLGLDHSYDAVDRPSVPVTGSLTVSHQRRIAAPDGPLSFFVRLLDASKSISFGFYRDFIDQVFNCKGGEGLDPAKPCFNNLAGDGSKLRRLERELTDHGVGAYELLKTATEAFLLFRCCVRPCGQDGSWPLNYTTNFDLGDYRKHSSEEWREVFCKYLGNQRLPYIQRVIDTAFPGYQIPESPLDKRFCTDVLLRSRVDNPCFMELIWNYWHEEGMLVQSINAVSRRFQNLRAPGVRDPLAHVEIDPLRPLNNILWGYVEDERDRLSIKRRAYEYQHQYGLSLYGKAVADLRPADSRSKFIEAFHNLLNKCADYYRAKQDTTVDPDGYPILHAIQELNLILAQGAHNQFGDLAWTARVEMLMQEWIMARPEMRDFLQSRAMVPYKEAWMPQVDTMKTLQGWTDVVITHFRDLGVFGEQIMLTIRWYNWYDVTSEEEAKGWADLLRAQIQSYIHAYRAVTGVDLSTMDGVDYTMPSVHLRKRLALQQRTR